MCLYYNYNIFFFYKKDVLNKYVVNKYEYNPSLKCTFIFPQEKIQLYNCI